MNRTASLSMALALLLLFAPHAAFTSTGGEEPTPEFNSPWGPVRPLSELASGSLGVVEASWWRKPLMLAWYRFNGETLPAGALEAFTYGPRIGGAGDGTPALQTWSAEAKVAAPDLPSAAELWGESRSIVGNEWDMFNNCPNAAWEQASKTLAERSRAWGVRSPALRYWIAAQHRVFARCPLGPSYFRADINPARRLRADLAPRHLLPDMRLLDPPAGSPKLLAYDRVYQRAAALLYEGHYAEAEKAFMAIGQDPASPWREWGAYESLRARLRDIQITPAVSWPDNQCQTPVCNKAREDYRLFIGKESARLRADVKRALDLAAKGGTVAEVRRLSDLQSLVAARLDPAARFRELAAELSRPGADTLAFQRAVVDYLHLHRQFLPSEPLGEWMSGMIEQRDPSDIGQSNGVAMVLADSSNSSYEEKRRLRSQWSQESLKRYQKQPKQRAWLFSAAVFAERGDPHLALLLKSLAEVANSDPGATSFMLHRMRLAGRDEALPLAASLLQRPDVQSDHSARNRVREYRLQHASSLPEFWTDALREAGTPFDRDTLLKSAPVDATSLRLGWDVDTKWILNYELPHSALLETARRSPWPVDLRRIVAKLAFARALLRKDAARVREALGVLAELGDIAMAPQIAKLREIRDDKIFMLESGVVPTGIAPRAKIDGTCRLSTPKPDGYHPDYEEPIGEFQHRSGVFAERILSTEQRAAWRAERKVLDALPDLTSAWMQNVLDFAKQFPADERVPSLLHEAVYATRLNWCADESAAELSKKAFTLLKTRYPTSEQARTSKYWFKPKS
ncbi:hypothetical protein BH11PSE11_BH11PSE11_29170 [soil metagenome]